MVIGHILEGVCCIELWIMSCGVPKRDMENAMMKALRDACIKRGITRIKGFYYPTAKNGMVKEFYATQGFDKISEDASGNTEWELLVTEQTYRSTR